ncbi:hypothetical protein IQ270_03560 [Microcoleus sp. LEGE 07076]|uniref:hypothetical protein n=1 Tax=Microcoleus sp. LEGE 07076 TaxID=915322 RepID=UPI001881B0AA|nr:hypothetical protein [Microcoleus sp. LEGE 07076]MBE9183824.1 hypothetical protein [Microcoleus sp. LEGE 07076]
MKEEGRRKKEEGRRKRGEGRGETGEGRSGDRAIGRSTNLRGADRPPLLSIPY